LAVVAKMKDRADKRKKKIVLDSARRGQMIEKAWEIEMKSQTNIKNIKVARDGNSHEHLLNETEATLKFGIFMLTLMYFRAMTFLKREQKSWSGEDDEIGTKQKGKKIMTDERMRILEEESKINARKKKIDNVLARCKVGESRRIEVRITFSHDSIIIFTLKIERA
jgi:hypothetical protein